jgi:Replication-relaxation
MAVLAASARLTARDRLLVRCVGEHRVLTTTQAAAFGFGSVITARHRLAALEEIGALRRFRPHREMGSAPWHYLLGPVGAALLGAEDRDERKWLTAVRADRQLALERSQRLAHLVGANWFFVSLAAHARTTGEGGLRVWLNESDTHDWLYEQVAFTFIRDDVPSPDGLGVWAGEGGEARFVLEYDTGSEHLPQLAAKLPRYGRLTEKMAQFDRTCPLMLFCFPTPRREQAARRALASCYDAPGLRIATTAINPEDTSPAGHVWLPLRTAQVGGQVALSRLDAALPDPWRDYRAEQERARQQAAQAARQPPWAHDPYDINEARRLPN